ncbi:GNAT family N-acetyltransferase [Alienimonas californiensis]|uniref:Putative N-acetyltransferase YjcF n=1 Tax=Alienimonas californiensis TaxID=2527989 RepID=A0A517P6D0_9PLAN|nr:GNAT family N-acetyltransferase [Alienimonas californiensis]QDT14916.1 putative N-acetyltransferase YjcF [Alienimonas californiensis]
MRLAAEYHAEQWWGGSENSNRAAGAVSMETKLRLGLQVALNGWIGDETRLVTAAWTRETVSIIVYTHGEIAAELAEDLREEVAQCLVPTLDPQYSGTPVVNVAFVRLDDPQPIPVKGIVIFSRRGVSLLDDVPPHFREIPFGSAEYRQEYELRDEVLRRPLGHRLADDDLSGEAEQLHFGLFDAESLLACVVAVPLAPGDVKLRQMAVRPDAHGQGLGRRLMEAVEQELTGRGVSRVTLHARATAVGFYEKLGYRRVGEEFVEVTIPHFKMQKDLTRKDCPPTAPAHA